MAIGLTGVLRLGSHRGLRDAVRPPDLGAGRASESWLLVALAYVWTYGRRAALAGETGDISAGDRGDLPPTSA